jgi:hypothetical protein
MGSLDWWIDLLDNHQADLQILITLQKVTGTITHKVFNTSTLSCSLCEFCEQVCTQSLLFCRVLGLGFYCPVGLSGVYNLVVCLSLRQVLVEPYKDHRLQGFLLRVTVFRWCVNDLVRETLLYVLPGINVCVVNSETCFNRPLPSNGFICHNILFCSHKPFEWALFLYGYYVILLSNSFCSVCFHFLHSFTKKILYFEIFCVLW